MPRHELRAQLAPIRMKFLLVAGFGFSLFAATADLAIGILYDQRYHAAGWMLPVLIIGAWFSIMSNLNESTLWESAGQTIAFSPMAENADSF